MCIVCREERAQILVQVEQVILVSKTEQCNDTQMSVFLHHRRAERESAHENVVVVGSLPSHVAQQRQARLESTCSFFRRCDTFVHVCLVHRVRLFDEPLLHFGHYHYDSRDRFNTCLVTLSRSSTRIVVDKEWQCVQCSASCRSADQPNSKHDHIGARSPSSVA